MGRCQSSYGTEGKMLTDLMIMVNLSQWKEESVVMAVALTNSNHMKVGNIYKTVLFCVVKYLSAL